ncbi:MAG: LemA family protein [Nitrospirae bacterium]|nr:LemA family protein [Nitrospirota bacterium]
MKKVLIMFGVIIAIFVIVVVSFVGIYNSLVQSQEQVNSAWAQVENVYQRRADLVPNLVETVKGYASHEKITFLTVTEARGKAIAASKNITVDDLDDQAKIQAFQEAQAQLSGALSRLLLIVENYPDLKASQNFLALQSQLEGTENRIAVERRRFNEAARAYNAQIRQMPANIIAGMFGFKAKAYFRAEEGSEVAPKVKF